MTDGIAPQAAEPRTQTLETAVLLTATPAKRSARLHDGIGPWTALAGLTLFQRALLTLQRAGMTQVLVLAGDEERPLRKILRRDQRITLTVRWMPVREFPLEDRRTWEALSGEAPGGCLVLGGTSVFSRQLVEHLRREARDGQDLLIVTPAGDRRQDAGPFGYVTSFDMLVLPAGWRMQAAQTEAVVGTVAEPSPIASDSPPGLSSLSPIRMVIRQAATDGRVRKVAAAPDSGAWHHMVRTPTEARRAEGTLIRSLKGEFEGLIDRYFNRYVSSLLTRGFLRLGLSPNAITTLSLVIGLTSAAAFAVGNYAAGLIGALLFQLAAIVDCCDGEVARVTFAESRFGAQLDLATDNVVHMALFGGIGIGVFHQYAAGQGVIPTWGLSGLGAAWVPLGLGGAAMAGNALSFWLVNRAKARRERATWMDPKQARRMQFLLKHVASRDFSVVILLFALCNSLEGFLWLAAIGSNVFWMIVLAIARPFTSARSA
ncbi:MAG: CDP-alcohol phosphatidyltransferase family protein [Nitrospirales bacterium]